MAALVTAPELAAYRVISASERNSGLGKHVDTPALIALLRDQAAAASSGSLTRVEAMLMNQATALQTLFSRLAERGMGCETASPFESNMRMALRAQAQCRAALETVAMIRNPPVLIARQANVTTGPQQINNGPVLPSRAGESEIVQNQLLGEDDGKRSDTTKAATAGSRDSAMAAVDVFDRSENS